MANIFQLHAPCALFREPDGSGVQALVTFQRATRSQTTAGEVVLSYATPRSLLVSLQPKPAGYVRLLHGIVQEVAYVAFYEGNAAVVEGDRATLSSAQVEVVSVLHYGMEHTEIEFKHVGR